MADPVTLFVVGSAIAAGGQIYSGYQANQSAKREASALEAQGQLEQEEADREAAAHAGDVRKFSRVQALSFLKNGVTLEGSPLLVLDETLSKGQEEVDSITKSGAARRTLYNSKAAITRNEGRARMIGGITGAAGTIGSAGMAGANKGLFTTGGGSYSDVSSVSAANPFR